MPFINIKNLIVSYHNSYKDVLALNEFNADFENGKITAIIGPSGCGKTTLIRTICGFLDYEGTILADGINYATMDYKKRNVSYVDQSIVMNPNIDVYNNLATPLIINKISRKEIDEKIKTIANDWGFDRLLSLFPSQLSVGQRQIILLAKALIKNPSLLLLDEAFSNIDKDNKTRIISAIKKEQRNTKMTILYITHSYEEIENFADCIMVMENGKNKQMLENNPMFFDIIKVAMNNNFAKDYE